MTSKEALNYILENAVDDLDVLFDNDLQLSFKIIERDLKVLEIIWNHTPSIMRLNLCNTVKQYNKIYIDNNPLQKRILNEDEFKLLKEWLENARD